METRVLRRGDAGFTLLEVMIAMVILGIALLGMQAAMSDRLVSGVGGENRRTAALELVAERVQTIQADPVYGELEDRYEGDEGELDSGFSRRTEIDRTQDDRLDYLTVTVTVTHDRLAEPVARTLVIAAP